MSLLEKLEQIDQQLMLALNGKHNAFFDVFMQAMSNKYLWIPLYLILFYLIFRLHGKKYALLYLLVSVLAIGLTDWVSVNGFKEVFMRWRPCHNTDIGHLIHTVDEKCGGRYGFISSHAANHFAIAWLFGIGLYKKTKWWLVGLLVWAAVIGYSRVYLGVHYPADVLAGALLGSGIAIAVTVLFNKYAHKIKTNE